MRNRVWSLIKLDCTVIMLYERLCETEHDQTENNTMRGCVKHKMSKLELNIMRGWGWSDLNETEYIWSILNIAILEVVCNRILSNLNIQ